MIFSLFLDLEKICNEIFYNLHTSTAHALITTQHQNFRILICTYT